MSHSLVFVAKNISNSLLFANVCLQSLFYLYFLRDFLPTVYLLPIRMTLDYGELYIYASYRKNESSSINFRYHNDRMINYDKERGIKVTKDSSGSTLTLNSAHSQDSGNYTCSPYNIRAASVLVHVLSEGNSAAAVQNEQDKDSKMSQNKKAQKAASSAVTERTPPSAAVHSAANADRVIVIPSLLLSAILLMLHSATMTVFLSETRRSS